MCWVMPRVESGMRLALKANTISWIADATPAPSRNIVIIRIEPPSVPVPEAFRGKMKSRASGASTVVSNAKPTRAVALTAFFSAIDTKRQGEGERQPGDTVGLEDQDLDSGSRCRDRQFLPGIEPLFENDYAQQVLKKWIVVIAQAGID